MIKATTPQRMENWKQIKGYEGIYEISDLGNVKRTYKNGKIKFLKPVPTSEGYPSVGLCINNKSKTTTIHSLIAKHFLPITGEVVNHIDGNITNNAISNLEWVSIRENTCHAM